MTVRELISWLKVFDQDLDVVLASDSEGNSFSPLDKLSHQPMTTLSKRELEYDPDGKDTVTLLPLR